MNIDFTQEEANAMVQLIDIAVKSAGLNVAQAATVLANKFQTAFAPQTEEEK